VVVDAFRAAAAQSQTVVHGPCANAEAARVAVERVVALADGRAAAVPVGDPTVDALEIAAALDRIGHAVLRADDPTWRVRISEAGVGVTSARLGVADTATMLIPTGAGRPRGTHIIPPAHLCLLRVDDLVTDLGSALDQVDDGMLPSALSWVSGPSRTADLEMRPTIGVHGPCTVEVVLISG
jgi:L-lactate utilization protein LutC